MMDLILSLAPAWAEAHAPALIVLLPLLAAPIANLVPTCQEVFLVANDSFMQEVHTTG